jgi:hypothetical protein
MDLDWNEGTTNALECHWTLHMTENLIGSMDAVGCGWMRLDADGCARTFMALVGPLEAKGWLNLVVCHEHGCMTETLEIQW